MRPTRQRTVLGRFLFAGSRHLTAEMLHKEVSSTGISVSLATVYNTLNQLTAVGLLRQVSVDGAKTYFDTNVAAHYHFYSKTGANLWMFLCLTSNCKGCPKYLEDMRLTASIWSCDCAGRWSRLVATDPEVAMKLNSFILPVEDEMRKDEDKE
jgi:hypothetical protein